METFDFKNYMPISLYNNTYKPISDFSKYKRIDIYNHDFLQYESIDMILQAMEKYNFEEIHIQYCNIFQSDLLKTISDYKGYENKIKIWAPINYTNFQDDNWVNECINQIKHYNDIGIFGIGEMIENGQGDIYAIGNNEKISIDNEKLDKIYDICGELNMPVSIHAANPIFLYYPCDSSNEAFSLSSYNTFSENVQIEKYWQSLNKFENVIKRHSNTKFIGCHFCHLYTNLDELDRLLVTYNNLYVDTAASLQYLSSTPNKSKQFFIKHKDRILYGTDCFNWDNIWQTHIDILEGNSEHFYNCVTWLPFPLYGLNLPDDVLNAIYYENIKKLKEN